MLKVSNANQYHQRSWRVFPIGLCLLLSSFAGVSESYPDPLLTTPGTPDVIAQGLEADGYHLGISVYNWGYPLVRMERVAREYTHVPTPKPKTSYRAPVNQIGWATALATPDAKDMPTANNDTFYMSAVVKLNEPFVLSVPDTNDRYYVVNIFNMWQELEHYIGRRTTGTKAGRFAIVPPGWQGTLPQDISRLDVNTDKVWLWGRLRLSQGESVEPVLSLQRQFDLRPLSALDEPNYIADKVELVPLPDADNDSLIFLEHLAEALNANEVKDADEALFAQFARIGLTKNGFDREQILPDLRKGLERALTDGPSVAVASFSTLSQIRNGWSWVTGLDSFGFNYPLRAVIAGPYLGGQGEQEAMYPIRYTDDEGLALHGDNRYLVKLSSAPPLEGFWSLTIYNADDKMLVDNPLARYKVGSDTPSLYQAEDGSITIPIQHQEPKGEHATNWLPAPEGEFYVILRLYQPSAEILNGSWKLPDLKKVK